MFVEIDSKAREKFARELARCHRLHLLLELQKSPDLLANITMEGITFEQHVKEQLKELEETFPGLSDEQPVDLPDFPANIIREWYETTARLEGSHPYEEGTFKSMNVFFLGIIRFFMHPSLEILEGMTLYASKYYENQDVISMGLKFQYFARMERNLARLIESRIRRFDFQPANKLVDLLDQSTGVFTEGFYRYVTNLLELERGRSDALLRNILPDSLALALREEKNPPPIHYDSATVVFTDFVGFSRTAGDMTPVHLVEELDRCFSVYDSIMEKYGLEKLKTIGDSYMFAGGIPDESEDHAYRCVRAALEIRDYTIQQRAGESSSWGIRIGVHTGPLVAGIIGHKKFSYDIWGNTVNIASRMESSGDPDCVNLSADTYRIVQERIRCRPLGTRSIKNCGEMSMYAAEEVLA